jgi:predicted Mrr-cat superfamily restriction endonuclease
VKIGDIVVLTSNAGDTREVALCVVNSPYVFDPTLAADDDGCAHQRIVRFLSHPTHGLMIDRRHLPMETLKSMTQGTLHGTESGPLVTWLGQQRMA